MPTVRRTEPRSPIEEQILQTIARLDSTVWKHSDEERQERDADVIMRSVVGPALEQARRDAIEEVAAAIEAKAATVENFALRAVIAEGANIARDLAACKRCGGTAIDPEDSHSGMVGGWYDEPPIEAPCRDCVIPSA